MKRANFVTIQGWMRTDLGLTGNELLVYAVIYGFSQTEDQSFTGTVKYLADWCGTTSRSIQTYLKDLLDRGLITREERADVPSGRAYRVRGEKISQGGENISPGGCKNFIPGGENISPNNIDININKKIKESVARFQKPTMEEIQTYIREKGLKVDADRFMDYYDSNGWKVGKNPMKDWKATLRNWSRADKEQPKRKGTFYQFGEHNHTKESDAELERRLLMRGT